MGEYSIGFRYFRLKPLRCISRFKFILVFLFVAFSSADGAQNNLPRFALGGISEIVVRIKEGPTSLTTPLYRLRGEDADKDTLTFGAQPPEGPELLRFERISPTEADVFLRRELDREAKDSHTIVLTLTDGRLPDGQFITQTMIIIVEDVNDNEPIFKQYTTSHTILEDASPRIIDTLEASDRDQGPFGQLIYQLQPIDTETSSMFAVQQTGSKAQLALIGRLDYERKFVYEVRILAIDRANVGRRHTATAVVIVKVEDVEDQPPVFTQVPPVTRIPEDLPLNSAVLSVKAMDGDRGINNPVSYHIISGGENLFGIDSSTGIVSVLGRLDRESTENRNGAFILNVEAREEGSRILPVPTTRTEVTIVLTDVNDETPKFRSRHYVAEITENAQISLPVTFLGDSIPEVYDHDLGTNGTFRLYLEEDGGVFEVTPSEAVNDVSFMIRVKNPATLDFEKLNAIKFKIVAQEKSTIQQRSSSTDVTVYIRDANDNFPVFREEVYRAVIPENAAIGTLVTIVQATDADSGDYGTSGIRYTVIRGQIADKLSLDPVSGRVTVATDKHGFDRETTSEYTITVEARDDKGYGNRNSVQVQIYLQDINDNPPLFVLPAYEARIRENEPKFNTPLIVHATDADLPGTDNSAVRYQIVGGDPKNNFTIDPEKGVISPRTPLDFESIPQKTNNDIRIFYLVVRAFDLGIPMLSSNVTVRIYVQDTNDHEPVFSSVFMGKSIPEDSKEGTSILRVQAEDKDQSPSNSKILYRIDNGAQDKFVIDATTGVISVAPGANLDPDRTFPKARMYSLRVLALDGGLGEQQMWSALTVNISILDVNNKAPVLIDPGIATIPENQPAGTTVTRLLAKDLDDRPLLRYSLCDNNEAANDEGGTVAFDIQKALEVNAISGDVITKIPLDRETVETLRACVRVEDRAAVTVGQTAIGTLTVRVTDINDNTPIFKKPFYREAVTENSKVGSPIVTVRAIDIDQNRSISYSLEGHRNFLPLVKIDKKTGEVVVAEKIDREQTAWINVTVRATDSGIPPLTGSTSLSIQILDENDNNPVFMEERQNGNTQAVLEYVVSEDATVGSKVATVTATDADAGENGRITYGLDPKGTHGKFRIDKDTGEITVATPLDREEIPLFNLIVQAWDNYESGFGTDESRKAFKQITIRLNDVNDETPKFIPQNQCAAITEFHRIGETVLLAAATDSDDPASPNSRVVFTLQESPDAEFFDIETQRDNSAKVTAKKSLRSKVGNFSLTLKATDQGKPPRSATQVYSVCVSDVNDHPPEFIKPPQNYTIRIPENATIGTVVVEVYAEDEDYGPNAVVKYKLKELPNGHWRTFSIDTNTGVMFLRLPLDRESQKVYELRVEATDQGQPTPLTSDLDLTVYVTDVNDYAPEFTEDATQLTFTENVTPGSETYKLISTIDRDDDFGTHKPIPCYYIVGGNERGRFALDLFTHQLSATEVLDREEKAMYTLIVQASDDCFHPPKPVERFDAKDNTLLEVNIKIVDVNDNAPRFVRSIFTGGVTSRTDFGVAFTAVKAIDLDEGDNSVVHYYIAGDVHRTLSEGLDSITDSPFILDKNTGEISLNFYPQREMKGYFDFQVIANDSEGMFDTASVFIYLLREDQRVRFVLRLTPEEFREKEDEFRAVLANITGAIVNVDEVKVHENSDGSVDRQKSDLYLHFVNPVDNSIMDVDTVIALIDKNTLFLDKLFKEFNVLYSEAAEAQPRIDDDPNQLQTWLVGLTVFLTVMLILVISLCCAQRNRYQRQLKAATAAAFGSRDAQAMLGRDVVPNTNQHSVEGSNPIWMHSYDNEWFKDDDELRPNPQPDSNSLDENAVIETGGRHHHNNHHQHHLAPAPPASHNDRDFSTTTQLCSDVYVLSVNGQNVQNITIGDQQRTNQRLSKSADIIERNNLNKYHPDYSVLFNSKMGRPDKNGKLEVSEL